MPWMWIRNRDSGRCFAWEKRLSWVWSAGRFTGCRMKRALIIGLLGGLLGILIIECFRPTTMEEPKPFPIIYFKEI